MQNRFVAGLTLACLIAIAFAASAVAVDISRTSEPPLTEESNMTPAGPGVRVLRVMPGSAPPLYSCDPTGSFSQLTLWAGQHYDVGTVFIETYDYMEGTDNAIRVIYSITGEWHLTEYHLYVGEDTPPKSAPGRFPYGGEGFDTQYLVVDHFLLGEPILYADYMNGAGCVIMAAHAVVEDRSTPIFGDFDLGDFNDMLPDCAPITVNPEPLDGEAYFGVDVLDTILAGDDYDGWCVDTSTPIDSPVNYDAQVFSSYEPAAAAWVDKPENLDLVNWILNQEIIGESVIGCEGPATYGDVQRAMWQLIDDDGYNTDINLGPWTECRANAIQDAAVASGEGYMPDCGDYVGVILVPYASVCGQGDPFQILIIPVLAECDEEYGDETAWAKDYDSDDDCDFRTGWGSYFQFCD